MSIQKGFLISLGYDGQSKKAILKFLNEEGKSVTLMEDPYNHKPYCYSDELPDELEKNQDLVALPGFEKFDAETKFDALLQKEKPMTKIIVSDPLSISGKPSGTVRSVLRKVWEADIPYVLNYIYDSRLRPGQFYVSEDGELSPLFMQLDESTTQKVEEYLAKAQVPNVGELREWMTFLEQPIPNGRRAAIDIEVIAEGVNRLPDVESAKERIGAISFADNSGEIITLLLVRRDLGEPSDELKKATNLRIFENENDMLLEAFSILAKYPVIVTYNGDNFDLPYLRNRAKTLGIPEEKIPIKLGRDFADIKGGVHIDLYRFFLNRSIQIYAFNNVYKEATLDAISKSLLGRGKIKVEQDFSKITYIDLWKYCSNDADITIGLTTYDDSIVVKLIVMLMRISRSPMEEIVRHAVSSWIRSLFIALHRERGILVPNNEDIIKIKGETVTRAVIKGKKYLGAIVLKPEAGAHFNVVVMDFASLYPSVIARYNLSYETVMCPHPECRDNKVADLPHWVCKKVVGLTSSTIGTLRDLRVNIYVPMSKDKELSPLTRKRYEAVQRALKVFLNASYGVMGAESFQFYTPPVAESVTAVGRMLLTSVIQLAKERGINIIYGDTDSIFLKEPTQDDIRILSDFAYNKYGIQLNFDKKYRYAVFSSRKKNYFGVTEDMIPDVKGLIGKKSSTPEFVKKTFFEVLSILSKVKNDNEFEQARRNVEAILKDTVERLKKKQIPVEDLSFNIMMSKDIEDYRKTTPQHIKAAMMQQKNGEIPKAGDMVSYVKVKGRLGVKPTNMAKPDEIDVDKYMEIMTTTFEQILEPLGVDISGKGKSSKLLDFM